MAGDELSPEQVAALANDLAGAGPADDGIRDIAAKVEAGLEAEARAAEQEGGE